MKIFLTAIIALSYFTSPAQTAGGEISLSEWQQQLNAEYKNPATSPLDSTEALKFTGHIFYPSDSLYIVNAIIKKDTVSQFISMPTSSGKIKNYSVYGKLEFYLHSKLYSLMVYQSESLKENPEYADYLFLPFTDETSGITTYGGGRYIDLRIPATDSIKLDFNRAYNPYCAYATGYSCPIPPKENHLPLQIKAGVKKPVDH